MSRLHIFRVGFLTLMLMLLAALAPTVGASPLADNTVWSGEYFNNVDLIGPAALLRGDPNINFYWGEGVSPAPGYVGSSYYSIRWTRSIYFDSTGTWTFTTVNDDGMRVWVDGNITMDAWYDQGPTQHTGSIYLTTGWHTVKVEYYNRANAGTAQVSWSRGSASPNWKGEYFNNQTVSGSPIRTRNDAAIDFDWGTGSPFGVIPVDHFSARWTGTVYLDAGTYRLTATADDGVRVWVDGAIQIDEWHNSRPTTYTEDVGLGAGNHTFKVTYFENTGNAQIHFSYAKVSGQPTPPPPPPSGTWYGQYFNNVSLSGSPVLVRNDAAVNFNWGEGSPGPNVQADNFSVKWDGTVNLANTGDYNVIATSDDGVRVWIDGAIALDWWYDHPPQTFTSTRHLNAGAHAVHVEYYDRTGGAMINVQITPVSAPPTGVWYGQYYNNMTLSGSPVMVRNDAVVNFDWGTGSPGGSVPADYFSAKWDATINYGTAGNYNVTATSDDGVRVWIDGAIAIDAWYDHAPTTFTSTRYLNAGAHAVHVEYYERTGGAMVNVQIALGSAPPPPPSTGDIIVDDRAAGWQAGGCPSCWRASPAGVGNHSFWTWNNTYALEGYNWARWYPYLPHAGYYEVFAYIPGGVGNTTNARYWVKHAGQYNLAARNQGAYYNQWASLGTYYFGGTADENVSLTDVTYESYLSHTLVFDAIKFSPR